MRISVTAKKVHCNDRVAITLKGIAFAVWLVGGIEGVVLLFYNLLTAIIFLISVFVSGLFVFGAGHIVQLLSDIKNNDYVIEIPDEIIAKAYGREKDDTAKAEKEEIVTIPNTVGVKKVMDYKVPLKIIPDNEGYLVCPECKMKNKANSSGCSGCGVLFMNNTPKIPYWCGKCGNAGPYEGNCPVCNSSIKDYNTVR